MTLTERVTQALTPSALEKIAKGFYCGDDEALTVYPYVNEAAGLILAALAPVLAEVPPDPLAGICCAKSEDGKNMCILPLGHGPHGFDQKVQP